MAVGSTITLPAFASVSPTQNSVSVYNLSTNRLLGTNAELECATNFGGRLCQASDTVSWERMKTAVAPHLTAVSYYIGGTDAVTEGIWLWPDGSAVADWPYIWATNRP